jgi:rubrerythrin
MENQELIKYLKIALKNEEESSALYHQVAEEATNGQVKDFFYGLEQEENLHYEYLMKYYQRYKNVAHVKEFALEIKYFAKPSKEIFTEDFMKDIAEHENIIMAMRTAAKKEKNAMEFYKSCKKYTRDKELIDFFEQMVLWEENHLESILFMFETLDDPEFALR